MQINPYLLFDGRCQAAFQFYADVLGGQIQAMIPHTGTPAETHVAPEWRDKIMHARMTVGNWVLMGSDAPPDRSDKAIGGFSIYLGVDDPQEAETIFTKLAENGTIRMPIQPTFWAARFGMLGDQFGMPWMINCEEKK